MKKKYIIVGDNNFWYATTNEISKGELADELEEMATAIKNGEYSDNDYAKPNTLFVYEADEVMRMTM